MKESQRHKLSEQRSRNPKHQHTRSRPGNDGGGYIRLPWAHAGSGTRRLV